MLLLLMPAVSPSSKKLIRLREVILFELPVCCVVNSLSLLSRVERASHFVAGSSRGRHRNISPCEQILSAPPNNKHVPILAHRMQRGGSGITCGAS